MELTQPLLALLNTDVMDVDPHQFLALRLRCDGDLVWTISDGVLTTKITGGTASSLVVQLVDYTVTQLARFFSLQPGYSVLYVDTSPYAALSSLVCMDGSGDPNVSNGDHIYAYTNYVWSYIDANASVLEQAQTDIGDALAQMSTTTAEDVWLDYLGTYYKCPRNQGEMDQPYAVRIISSVLLPSSNNVGMAIALQSTWPATQAIVTDAGYSAVGLLLRNGTIFFNSEFVHNSDVGIDSHGFFDVTFAFYFGGPIAPSAYVPLLLAAVNQYRAGGTYIQTLILKNGMSAGLLSQSYYVGPVLVEIYDQDVMGYDAFDWYDDEPPDDDDRTMYQQSKEVGAGTPSTQLIVDGWDWTAEEPDDDDRLSVDSAPVRSSGAPTPFPDDFDWTAEEPDQDEREALDSAAISILDAAPNPFPDDWDWTAEEPDEDDRMSLLDAHSVGLDGAAMLPAGSNAELDDEDIVEFFSDFFGNSDGAPAPFGDQWDWDEDPAVTICIDGYQNSG